MNPHMYTFLFFCALIFSFADAYGNGANDVANSFATSVSSGNLTLGQAVCIAIVTEFCGAYFLGSGTANTIAGSIFNVSEFSNQPELLMLGAIISMGIAAYGGVTVKWVYVGVAKIFTSWFVSPLIAGIVSSIIFLGTKYAVLKRENSF
ncbi:Phosphate-repressible phosphate permease pho-4, partial [Smittium mucronatum]